MIVYPTDWRMSGQPIRLEDIESAIKQALEDVQCDCLSFSGGVDSTLLLYYLLQSGRKVRTFTITCSNKHPDIHYSEAVLRDAEQKFKCKIESSFRVLNGITGDKLVAAFYGSLPMFTDAIIAGDGIDEYMCGYYLHQKNQSEEVYIDFLRRLQDEHLIPLDKNSGVVKVWLPYLDNRVVSLLAQIPIMDKVDDDERKKVTNRLAEIAGVPKYVIERKKYGFCTSAH